MSYVHLVVILIKSLAILSLFIAEILRIYSKHTSVHPLNTEKSRDLANQKTINYSEHTFTELYVYAP